MLEAEARTFQAICLQRIDVYAMGLVLWEMAHRCTLPNGGRYSKSNSMVLVSIVLPSALFFFLLIFSVAKVCSFTVVFFRNFTPA